MPPDQDIPDRNTAGSHCLLRRRRRPVFFDECDELLHITLVDQVGPVRAALEGVCQDGDAGIARRPAYRHSPVAEGKGDPLHVADSDMGEPAFFPHAIGHRARRQAPAVSMLLMLMRPDPDVVARLHGRRVSRPAHVAGRQRAGQPDLATLPHRRAFRPADAPRAVFLAVHLEEVVSHRSQFHLFALHRVHAFRNDGAGETAHLRACRPELCGEALRISHAPHLPNEDLPSW